MKLAKTESETVEFKISLSDMNSILRTICAFANTNGGHVYIGVRDDGTVVGIDIGRNTIENLANDILMNTLPPVYVSINVKKFGGREVIVINVVESKTKPHFYKGIAYKRIGKSNHSLSPQELESLYRDKLMHLISFDCLASRADLDEISEIKLKEFYRNMLEYRNQDIVYKSKKDFLKRLGLLIDNELTNAAVMFFGNDPDKYYPNLNFKCVYREKNDILDYGYFTGTILEILENVILFLRKNLKRRVIIKGLKRKEILEIPDEALREAIINSLIHRDYFSNMGNYLEITEEYVLIKNPGTLDKTMSIEDLYKDHESIPRNPKLASLAYLNGSMEQWGSGTTNIVKRCVEFNLKIPKYNVENNVFYTKIYRVKNKIDDTTKRILSYLSKKPANAREISKKLRINYRRTRYLLLKLEKQNAISSKGKTRTKVYFI